MKTHIATFCDPKMNNSKVTSGLLEDFSYLIISYKGSGSDWECGNPSNKYFAICGLWRILDFLTAVIISRIYIYI